MDQVMTSLDGKVIVVTGGAQGIGYACAQQLIRAGARVLLIDSGVAKDGSSADETVVERTVQKLNREDPSRIAREGAKIGQPNAIGLALDVQDPTTAGQAIERAAATFGQIDGLVCAAGILSEQTLRKVEPTDFLRSIQTQLAGSLYFAQAFAGWRAENKIEGRAGIVLFSSQSAFFGNYGQASFAATNAGILGLMRSLAIELQRKQIYVNCIVPLAKTRLTEALPMFENVQTMGAEHVAPAVQFFLSDLSGEKTGYALGVAGARCYGLKIVETPGRFKEIDDGVWSAEEIAEHWDSIMKG
jgi:NAD(P)-dependent dehydrogenase (short-subunit alcohol dehydrogenase family)